VSTLAERCRADLADALAAAGPDAPTLCTGWRTRDLAAHVVVRERRPDAALGIVVAPLRQHGDRVRDEVARGDWEQLLATVRTRSPLLPGPLDALVNTVELYVHTEDVRRAQPGWAPRPTDPATEDAAWRMLRQRGRVLFRRSPVGVVLVRPDGATRTARSGPPSVTLRGPATELLLYGFGRTSVARVSVEGDPGVVAAFAGTDLSA
jgi:uncharacterized protein (TIGR03085 family)